MEFTTPIYKTKTKTHIACLVLQKLLRVPEGFWKPALVLSVLGPCPSGNLVRTQSSFVSVALHRGFHPCRADHRAGGVSVCLCASSKLIYLVQKESHKFISVFPPCAFDSNVWLHILWGEHLKQRLFSPAKKTQKPLEVLPTELQQCLNAGLEHAWFNFALNSPWQICKMDPDASTSIIMWFLQIYRI